MHHCEYSNFEAQKAYFPGLQTVRPDRKPFAKITESSQVWYLKHPKNCEDRRTRPGMFFGGTELRKSLWNEKLASGQDRVAAAAVHGGSGRPSARVFPINTAPIDSFTHSICVDGCSLLPYAPCGSFTAFLHLV
ncbi:hypothetical protein JCGZ_06024 [Jatropha curcas]|uniref:Uncharacterized protein n=1 Tax=Jatropha curcas TaxID=180498 RepID=A0A067JCG2_JATCU|nr:hypothetical protein JCGZ_06024 [Jatropha curcas]